MAIKTNTNLIHLDAERIQRRGDKPMTGPEVLDEFEFLIDTGAHPLLAAQLLGVKYKTLHKLALRYGRAELFTRVDIALWDRYVFGPSNSWSAA